jgi:DNA-binding SARP family transcriptional activator
MRERVCRSLGRKPLALLALAARSRGHAVSRDRALALLWPETDQDRGRNALNQTVFLIRRTLGADALTPARYEIALNAGVWTVDVAEFERAVDDDRLERAVDLYHGPFLDGFYVPNAGEFERWVDGERMSLRRDYIRSVEQLASAADARADHSASARWWEQLVHAEPLSMRFTLALMRALAAIGEHATAIDAAHAYEAHVRSTLDPV